MYYGARYYVPGIGRFASADTLVPDPTSPQSYNRYSYVQNRPLNRIDPTGHIDCEVLGTEACTEDGDFVDEAPLPETVPSIRYYVSLDEAISIFSDMADQHDIPYAYPSDGCYDRAADMAQRISDRYSIPETHIKKAFLYGLLKIETQYIYPDINGTNIVWGYHVAPMILVQTEEKGVIWMIIDPSIMAGPATLAEWKETMQDPNAWFDFQDYDAYAPINLPPISPVPTNYDVEYIDVAQGKPIGGPRVDGYLALCVAIGYCEP